MNTGLDQYMISLKMQLKIQLQDNKKFRENTHRGDNFVHGDTKKDKFHPNGEVWLAC